MSYTKEEVKSGLLISLSIGLLLGLTFIVGKFTTGKNQTCQIEFGYISGLENNAPVRFAGYEVGKVVRIETRPGQAYPILVTAELEPSTVLKEDSQAFIDTLGMMGEKFLELSPGTVEAAPLAPGKVMRGTDPVPMHLLVRKMNLMADRVDQLTLSLNPMMEELNHAVAGHGEDISKMIANLTETSANIRDMTHDLKFRPWRLVRRG